MHISPDGAIQSLAEVKATTEEKKSIEKATQEEWEHEWNLNGENLHEWKGKK